MKISCALVCVLLFAIAPGNSVADAWQADTKQAAVLLSHERAGKTDFTPPFHLNATALTDSSAATTDNTPAYPTPKNQTRKAKDYFRIGAGLGYGLTDITPDDDDYSYYGASLGLRFGFEAPLVSFLSVHTAVDALWVSRLRLIEEHTTSFGMSLSAGLSLGQRDVPGNFHVTGSAGYGFASIEEKRDGTICFSTECEEAGESKTSLGPAYRVSLGYTMQQGALIELVALRIGETGDDFPPDTTAYLSSYMIMISNGL